MNVKLLWNSLDLLLQLAYQWWEFTSEWLKNPNKIHYWLLLPTQDKWTIVKYLIKVWMPFWHWILSMSTRYTLTPHCNITLWDDMYDHIDGIMWALPKWNTWCREHLYFTIMYMWQKLSKYYADVTSNTSMIHISANIVDPFQKLQSFWKWVKGLDIKPEDETCYTPKYQEAFLRYVENEYCVKYRHLPIIESKRVPTNNLFPSTMASTSGQSC